MITIAKYLKPEDAFLAASLLESNDIETSVRDADTVGMYWFYSDAVGGVKLDVYEDDASQARELLNISPKAPGLLKCPNCGSGRVKLREFSWITGIGVFFGFLIPVKSQKADCADCQTGFPVERALTTGTETEA